MQLIMTEAPQIRRTPFSRTPDPEIDGPADQTVGIEVFLATNYNGNQNVFSPAP